MKQCTLTVHDQVNIRFDGLDKPTVKSLTTKLSFVNPTARHTPAFKLGRWDGREKFFSGSVSGGWTYVNLLDQCLPIIEDAGYTVDLIDLRVPFDPVWEPIDASYPSDRCWPEGHPLAGQPIVLREHQVAAVNAFLANPQSLQKLATGFGKTMSSACLMRLCEKYGKTLTIVPSKSLIGQTEADFIALGLDVGVYFGDRKEPGRTHTIATWQSLSAIEKSDKALFISMTRDLIALLCDEVHSAEARVLQKLLSGPLAHVPIRWGMSGTIMTEPYRFYNLLCTIGPIVNSIGSAELQEKKVLSTCNITIIRTDDSFVKFKEYQDEVRFLTSDPDRLAFIADYISVLKESGNVLVLVNGLAFGKELTSLVDGMVFLSGAKSVAQRKEQYDKVQPDKGIALCCTYGIASTGINIVYLDYLVLLDSGKSAKLVIQSIGRVLRRAGSKTHAEVHDFCSTLKFSNRHRLERQKMYDSEFFPYNTITVPIRQG